MYWLRFESNSASSELQWEEGLSENLWRPLFKGLSEISFWSAKISFGLKPLLSESRSFQSSFARSIQLQTISISKVKHPNGSKLGISSEMLGGGGYPWIWHEYHQRLAKGIDKLVKFSTLQAITSQERISQSHPKGPSSRALFAMEWFYKLNWL